MKALTSIMAVFALNAAWQATIIAVGAGLYGWLLRRSPARVQHLLWEAAAILSIGLPVLTVIVVTRLPLASEPEFGELTVQLPLDKLGVTLHESETVLA